MKRLSLTLLTLTAVAMSAAQTPIFRDVNAAYLFDPSAKGAARAMPVLTAKLFRFESVLGRKGFDVDVLGLAGVNGGARLGFAAVHTFRLSPTLATGIRPNIGLDLGAWTNYGTRDGKARFGPFIGVSARF